MNVDTSPKDRRCACGSTKLLAVHPGNGARYAGPWKLPGGKVVPAMVQV